MVNNLKIKKYWIATLCMVFCSLSSFAQELSDATIGFDIERAKASLKEHGVKDQDLDREISIMREGQIRQYAVMKKIENEIAEKYKPQSKLRTNTARSAAVTDVSQVEKDALLAIYNSTGGANWTNKTGWDFSTPVVSWDDNTKTGWYGIIVTNGHITSLVLNRNNLVGTIPPSNLVQLSNLQYLLLNNNSLSGNISSDIRLLNNLINLDLSSNQFTGSIPSEIGQLINLQSLNLSRNQISGEIPSTIGSLSNLKNITLSVNKLTGTLPQEISNLTNLESLSVGNNKLSGNIYVITTLRNLTHFDIETNEFTGIIPTEIGMLNKLQYIFTASNKLSGNIPVEIGQLTNLIYLRLSQNNLSGNIPSEIGQLTKLTNLDLSGNQLDGSIPKTIGQLTLMQDLRFGANKLTGSIPSEINLLTNITVIQVHYNKLTGNIPSISQLKKLGTMYMSNNELTGNIPDLTGLPLFRYTEITNNKFRFVDIADQYTNYKKLSQFNYAPQAKTDTAKSITGLSGKSVTMIMCEDNRYIPNVDTFQWYKNGIKINGAESREYTIQNLTSANNGVYHCISTHPVMSPNLILQRESITLNVSNCPTVAGSITSTTEKFHTNAESSFAFETTATGLTYEWSVTPANGTAVSNTSDSYTHTFTEAGDYEVKVVATDAIGCTTTFTKPVKVEDRYCDKEPVDFVFNTTESNLTYNWTSTDSVGNIVHRETNATGLYTFTPQVGGEYVIELVASSATSCKTLFSKNIIIDQCTPYISCTKDNPLSPEIHRLFINMITKLASTPTGTDVNVYAHKEIAAVAPYTADLRAKIYNFTNTSEAVSFSFSATAAENEIYIPKSASGSITAINLDKYKDALTSTIVATSYTSGATNNSDGHVRNIDFCPKELSCISHIALVVDESGSLDLSEINKIKKQLKLFVAQQAYTNDDIGSNIHVSITGMSDSDANTRTDFIAPTKMTASNVYLFNAWIDRLGKRYGETGISQASDYWKSGLDGALAYTMKPTFVLMITDGSQTANVQGLKETFTKFDNNNKTVTVPKLPHLYVVGIENGNYVDRDSYTSKLSRDLDPNYNPSLASNRSITAKTTPLLKKSLQYLLGLSTTEFPVSDINQFNVGTYYGHSNFDLLASDETYFADKVVTGQFACGIPAVKDFCDDCFSFKPEPGKEYILSAWVKEESVEQVKTYTNPLIKLVFYNNKEALDIEAQKIGELPIKANGDIIDGWQRVVQKFKIPNNTITIGIELENLSPSIPVYFDDIRIHPLQGSVKSFVYDPETFKLMSELDENNYSTFYEYDNEGGLVRVKKETAKGVKTIQETRSGSVINTTTTTNP